MTAAGERTRQALHRAAVDLFATRGFFAVTLPELARAAGIASASVYRHAESKEALINEVLRERRQALDHALWNQCDAQLPVEAAFHELWRRAFAFSTSHTAALVLLELRQHDGYLDRQTRQLLLPSPFAPLASVLERGQHQGLVRPGQPAHLAEVARAIFLSSFRLGLKALELVDASPLMDARAIAWRALTA